MHRGRLQANVPAHEPSMQFMPNARVTRPHDRAQFIGRVLMTTTTVHKPVDNRFRTPASWRESSTIAALHIREAKGH